jgi:hypothetical protein
VDNDSQLDDVVPEGDVGVDAEGAANESVMDESMQSQTDGDQHE